MTVVADDRRLFFLPSAGLRRVQRWVERRARDEGGLTGTQAGLLFMLGKDGGVLIGEAAETLDVAPSAMSGLVDRMERANLIERRADARDGRAQRLYLTDAGRLGREKAKAALAELNDRLADGYSEAELAVVARWLRDLNTKFP
jgi:DNA-binding MarR family transcriptional regulator